ncbi:MAG TPA: sigma-70 family RNA polymerase sigma factor [Planctomycetaceae bacterium]|nr:sigma-70 family RNA polymerase sigma factor [Planctomycetaceae bacterium]HIQ21935.1 sigma-70 family RNA polymerase sigma factor [Planctomycetota bacterium]
MSCFQAPSDSRSISTSILEGVKRNDDVAWRRLTSLWTAAVYNWCRKEGLQPTDANDAVQTVFIRVHGAIGRFRRGCFRAWIWRITASVIADFRRAQAKLPAARGGSGSWVAKVPDEVVSDDDSRSDSQDDAGPDPDPATTRRIIVRRAMKLVRQSGQFEKNTIEAFWKTAVEQRPTKEVAQELGLSEGAVRTARYRVRKYLRELLEGQL